MAVRRLTERFIRSVRCSTRRQEFRDTKVTNLTLRVGRRDKVFTITYRSPGGRLIRETLGPHGGPELVALGCALDLTTARVVARKRLADVWVTKQRARLSSAPLAALRGVSGHEVHSAPSRAQGMKLGELVDRYLDAAKERKKTWTQDRSRLRSLILPQFGDREVASITSDELLDFYQAFVDEGRKSAARSAHSLFRMVFGWALKQRLVTHHPADLPAPVPRPKPRQRCLNDAEIRKFWRLATKQAERRSRALVYLLRLTTAQREGTLRAINAHYIEPDPKTGGAWWTVAPEHMKAGRSHRVYLTPLSLELLESRVPNAYGWYFPDHNTPSEPAPRLCAEDSADLTYGLRVAKVRGFQFKDLRRTAATLLAQEGVDRRIVSRILAHKDRSITAVYDVYSYDREVRDGMMRLDKRLRQIVGSQLDGGANG